METLVKDLEFNINTVTQLADDIKKVHDSFERDAFIDSCVKEFPSLELKQRMSHVTRQIQFYLTEDYLTNIDILTTAMNNVTNWAFVYGSVIEYVEVYGCTEEYLDISLEKLGEFTRLLSSEFAIRKFLCEYEEQTMKKVHEWTRSEDVNRRRLATEGTRPSLPWGPNITVHYKTAAKVLDNLFYDSERFVTRSCANHLNDISKMDPEFVLVTLKRWNESKKQNEDEMDYIIKHSLRTLIKKGHLPTLEFLGYKLNPDITVSDILLRPAKLHIGDKLEFEFTIVPNEDTKILVDYIITYPTKLGGTTTKVFKIVQFDGVLGHAKTLIRRRPFSHMSTRKQKPGMHKVSIQVNGKILQEKEFILHE